MYLSENPPDAAFRAWTMQHRRHKFSM